MNKNNLEEYNFPSEDISQLKKIESDSLDLTSFEGQKSTIADVKQIEVPSTYNRRGKQWCLKVLGQPVIVGDKSITPSELFNLKEDNDGNPSGWHSNSNLQKFLERTDAFHPEQLPGSPVMLRVRRKNDQQFLGFVIA